MNKIESIEKNFLESISLIDQVTNIGSDIADIVINLLNDLRRNNESLTGFIPYKEKLDIIIEQATKIKNHVLLKEKYSIIYNQSIVLLVSNLESYFSTLIISILDNYPELIDYPKDDKKIIFEVGILNYRIPTIGEVIFNSLKNEFNFQDLQSTLSFLSQYLKIDIKLEKNDIEEIIKYQALRHIIIHNLSKTDDKFLKQIRNTKYIKKYNINQNISLSEQDYNNAKKVFTTIASKLKTEIINKSVDKYGAEFVNIMS